MQVSAAQGSVHQPSEKSCWEKNSACLVASTLCCQLLTVAVALSTIIAYRETCSKPLKTVALTSTFCTLPIIPIIVVGSIEIYKGKVQEKLGVVFVALLVYAVLFGIGIWQCIKDCSK
jgi:tellurite resistance protein TehA-like permease